MKPLAYRIRLFGFERRIFWSLVFVLVLSVIVYIYGISVSIMNVVLREELEHQAALTHSRVATLESEYLKAKESLDLANAVGAGFTPVSKKEYVTRGSLSYNGNAH